MRDVRDLDDIDHDLAIERVMLRTERRGGLTIGVLDVLRRCDELLDERWVAMQEMED